MDQADRELGPVIFERPAKTAVAIRLVLAGVVCLMVAAGIYIGVTDRTVALYAIAFLGGALLCFAAALDTYRRVFRCHEFGILESTLLSRRQLKYTDVASFSYQATHLILNGVDMGVGVTVEFHPVPEHRGNTITFSSSPDEELSGLRDHVAKIIGERMRREFKDAGAVRWTDALRFLADGLEYHRSGILGHKDIVLIPYDQMRWEIRDGQFLLWYHGVDAPVLQLPVRVLNFFPGLYLLTTLIETPPSSSA